MDVPDPTVVSPPPRCTRLFRPDPTGLLRGTRLPKPDPAAMVALRRATWLGRTDSVAFGRLFAIQTLVSPIGRGFVTSPHRRCAESFELFFSLHAQELLLVLNGADSVPTGSESALEQVCGVRGCGRSCYRSTDSLVRAIEAEHLSRSTRSLCPDPAAFSCGLSRWALGSLSASFRPGIWWNASILSQMRACQR